MIQIHCINNGKTIDFPTGSELQDIFPATGAELPYPVISARVNNVSKGLNYKVYSNKDVEFLDVRDPSGMRTYVRSLCFVLYKAVTELFPNGKLFIKHPVSNGYYCSLNIERPITVEDVNTVRYAGKRSQRYTKAGLVKGQKNAFKKAIVTLKEGEEIDFYSNID